MPSDSTFDTKEQVRVATDIVDLVGNYLQLRRQGRNFVATCPWHDDRRPSLQINPERQTWKCWVCDVGGDVFSFVMRYEGIEFREALEMLAEQAGITLQQLPGNRAVKPGSPEDKRTLHEAMRWAETQYHQFLLHAADATPARRYLEERGISTDSIARFQVGFAPKQWQWLVDLAKSTPYSQKVLQAAGLIGISQNSSRPYDFFRGRVMFPIRDPQRRTVAFGGRVLPETADDRSGKYVNTVETKLFSKSDQLYGLDLAKDSIGKQKEVIVVEGYTDVIMCDQHGIRNTVAVLGTALGIRHIRLLRRFSERITLVLDGDEAGQRRMNEILDLFVAEEVDLRVLTLPGGNDPCDFVSQQGAEAMREMVNSAQDALEHKVGIETSGLDVLRDTHGAQRALGNVLNTMARSPRLQVTTDSNRQIKEQQIINRLAKHFQVSEKMIRQRLTDLRRSTSQDPGFKKNAPPPATTTLSIDPREHELLEILLLQPDTAPVALQAIRTEQISAKPLRQIYAVISSLVDQEEIPDFNRVLTHLEQPELKSLLVKLDEQAQHKAQLAAEDPETRLNSLLDSFRIAQEEEDSRLQRARLDDKDASHDEKVNVLRELFERKKNRLGTNVPTDG